MPRRKRASSPYELFDDDFDDDSNSSSRNGQPPVQRNAANARERARMRVLSSAFGRLKTKLPNIPPDTKLSKLDTLRLATMYIKQLRALAEGRASPSTDAINQMQFNDTAGSVFGMPSGAHSMTWPFGLHHIQNTAPRQVPFQCAPMDWNHTAETTNPVKCARLDDDSAYALPQTSHSIPSWYTPQTSNASTVPRMENYHNLNNLSGLNHMSMDNQNQHFMHGLSTTSAHHQNTMSPIR